jgi:hypothetical protein
MDVVRAWRVLVDAGVLPAITAVPAARADRAPLTTADMMLRLIAVRRAGFPPIAPSPKRTR